MKDEQEVRRIQKLIDKYNTKWNGVVPGSTCEHKVEISDITARILDGSTNTNGVATARCSLCGEEVEVDIRTNETRQNIMLISDKTVHDSGYSSAKEYMLAGKGNVFYQTEKGWGRQGFSSIQGMASMCDGHRIASQIKDGSQLYWQIKDMSVKYDADGTEKTDGKYISLIGYKFSENQTISGFALFTDAVDASLTGFDVLGRVKNTDGSPEWKVLWSGSNIQYHRYGPVTQFINSNFDETTVDAIQIGVTGANSNTIYASEFEVYGK